MKNTVLISIGFIMISMISNSRINPKDYLNLTKIKTEKNSDLFKIDAIDNEQVLVLSGNSYSEEIDEFTGKKKDDSRGGKVILFGDVIGDYSMTIDMKFLRFNVEDFPGGGWFGFAMRAQDMENFEMVWFMPGGGGESNTIAYLPVAHGVCPWWTEAYDRQEKGNIALPKDDWFTARVDVIGDEFTVYVNDQFVFSKKMSYYLTTGKPGLFVGTATDVVFRRLKIEEK